VLTRFCLRDEIDMLRRELARRRGSFVREANVPHVCGRSCSFLGLTVTTEIVGPCIGSRCACSAASIICQIQSTRMVLAMILCDVDKTGCRPPLVAEARQRVIQIRHPEGPPVLPRRSTDDADGGSRRISE
jgi:hypothetical protein